MDSPPPEDNILELMSSLDKTQLEKLWKLRKLTSLNEDQVQELQKLHYLLELGGLIDLAKKVPYNIHDLVCDRLDTQPVDDYVTDFEIRRGIFYRITRVACWSARGGINTALFAVLMVAPVHVLQSKLAALEDSYYDRKNQTEVDEMLSQWQITSVNGIQAFVNKGGSQKGVSAAAPLMANSQPVILQPAPTAQSPNHTQMSEAVKLCKRRDNNMCCFTGMTDPHEAYIFPRDGTENTHMITDMLEMFWDPDTVTQLVPLIRDRNFMESPQNLISMNGQLHTWFDDCKMALKSIGETENGVVVQFHWLREGKYKPNSVGADFETFTTQSGIDQGKCWGYNTAHRTSGLKLDTGQTFTLESDNPAHRPNSQLLKMSWDLRRVAAICGAAVGEPWEESDDEKYMDYYSEDETCSSVSEENNYPEVLRWREEVEGGIEIETDVKTEADVEIETDVEMETDEDGQPGDDFEGPSKKQGTIPDQQVMATLKMPCVD
ncbi:hypothetical protein Trisim1_000495 [Trichoderma cf. simile WF8]